MADKLYDDQPDDDLEPPDDRARTGERLTTATTPTTRSARRAFGDEGDADRRPPVRRQAVDRLTCPVCQRTWKKFPGADRLVQHALNHCSGFLPGALILKTLAEHLDSDFETFVGIGTLADEVALSYVTVWKHLGLYRALGIVSEQPAREKQIKIQKRADRRTVNYRVEIAVVYRMGQDWARGDADGVGWNRNRPEDREFYDALDRIDAWQARWKPQRSKDTGLSQRNPVEAASSTPRGLAPLTNGVKFSEARGLAPLTNGVKGPQDDLSSGSVLPSERRTDASSSPTAEESRPNRTEPIRVARPAPDPTGNDLKIYCVRCRGEVLRGMPKLTHVYAPDEQRCRAL